MQLALSRWGLSPERAMLAVGTQDLWVDGYRLEDHIGSGGTGTVYRVRHVSGRERAMKIADRELHRLSRQNSARFEREARALSVISDPGVVALHARGTMPDGRPYLVMDYVRGPTLQDAVAAHALPIADAVAIVRATAKALRGVHAAGVVHRDVSASNVLLRRVPGGAIPTLIDFGHAWIEWADMSDVADGCDGRVFGTPHYMSPEHIRGERIDARADLYGLGILLYELIAGEPPFDGDSPAQILREHLVDEVPFLDSPFGSVPGSIDDIILRCLQKNPAARYDSAADLVTALDAAAVEVAHQCEVPPGRA